MSNQESDERVTLRQIARSDQTFARDRFGERDLDSVYPDYATGSPIAWGGVYKIAPPGPSGPTAFQGTDWQVYNHVGPYEFKQRGEDGSGVTKTVPGWLAIRRVEAGRVSLFAPRDVGGPRLGPRVGCFAIRS